MELVYPILCQVITNGELASLKQQILTNTTKSLIRDSLMVRMGACRVPDRGSIPRRGDFFCASFFLYL